MTTEQPQPHKVAAVSQTSLGYEYVRCRANGTDDTAYVHQLCAIAGGADPHDVFSDCYDVHHLPLSEWLDLEGHVPSTPVSVDGDLLVPAIDTPAAVVPKPRWDHRQANLVDERAD